MSNFNVLSKSSAKVIDNWKSMQTEMLDNDQSGKILNEANKNEQKSSSIDFFEELKRSMIETNEMQQVADKKSIELATGKSSNLHETMLAMTQAQLTFDLMVQVRNRALEAYQEVMRMPV